MKLYLIQVIRKTTEGKKNPRVEAGDALDQVLQMVEKMCEDLPPVCWRKSDPDTEDAQGPDLWKININQVTNIKGAERINLRTEIKSNLGPGHLKSVGEVVRHLHDIQVDISQNIESALVQTLSRMMLTTRMSKLMMFLLKTIIKH